MKVHEVNVAKVVLGNDDVGKDVKVIAESGIV